MKTTHSEFSNRVDTECPFCILRDSRIVKQNASALLLYDYFPVSPGHSLIIPRRHIGSLFDATFEEKMGLMELLETAQQLLSAELQPSGYNIGINDGVAAGQTVPHLHIHLIPRYCGDVPDPRGGVRWVLPAKADYWTPKP